MIPELQNPEQESTQENSPKQLIEREVIDQRRPSQKFGDAIAEKFGSQNSKIKEKAKAIYERHKDSFDPHITFDEYLEGFGPKFKHIAKVETQEIPQQQEENNDSPESDPFPPRSPNAQSSTDFFRNFLKADTNNYNQKGLIGDARDEAILHEVANGNLDPACRAFKKVSIEKNGTKIDFYVMKRPLAVGSGKRNPDGTRDSVIVPGTPQMAAQMLEYNLMMPTPAMVDAMYQNADVKLSAIPLTPDFHMDGNGWVLDSNARIQKQLTEKGGDENNFAVGDKKIKVISNEAFDDRNPRATGHHEYGFYRANGTPIQEDSAHGPAISGVRYADYSSAEQMVKDYVDVTTNGKTQRVKLTDAIKKPQYAKLLNGSRKENGAPINYQKAYQMIAKNSKIPAVKQAVTKYFSPNV